MLFSTSYNFNHSPAELAINCTDGSPLIKVGQFKYLRLWIDSEFSFRPHIDFIRNKINASLRILYWSINCFTLQVRKQIVQQLLFPIIDYGDVIYRNTSETQLQPLNIVYSIDLDIDSVDLS